MFAIIHDHKISRFQMDTNIENLENYFHLPINQSFESINVTHSFENIPLHASIIKHNICN